MAVISVIVPVYKTEQYVPRCIDSILVQTFTDFELILVDDGSPDNCGAICDEYSQRDARIKVIHKENEGVSTARNCGIEASSGEYIMFCDSDDYVSPDWCETLLRHAQKNPDSGIVSNFFRVFEDGTIRCKASMEVNIVCTKRISYYEMFCRQLSGYIWNKIYKAEILKGKRVRFDSTICVAEDVKFNAEYYKHCDGFVFVENPLYYYFDNAASALHRYYPNWLELHLMPFYIRIPLIEEENICEYCDTWLSEFIRYLDIVFDERNCGMGLLQKLRYNQRMVCSEVFQYCLRHASCEKESPIIIKLLKKKNYYAVWLFQRAAAAKNRL
jgi:glycosyltransferase involved in cell wall biosynthesis